MSAHDVIVIGAGTNGLTTAGLLAKRGLRVLVLEQRDVVGGIAAGEEFHPGFRTAGILHDTTGVRRSVVDALRLGEHGLSFSDRPPAVLLAEEKGLGVLLSHDPQEAIEEISRLLPGDAARYSEYRSFIDAVRGPVNRLMTEPPPDLESIRGKLSLLETGLSLRRLGKDPMMELFRIGPMCVADWMGEWFESELIRAGMLLPAIAQSFCGPWSPGTAANLLVRECTATGYIRGGAAALARALEEAVRGFGAEIRTGTRVASIRIDAGRVAGVVLENGEAVDARTVAASCDPRHTFLDLVASREIPYRLEHRMGHLRGSGTTAKVHLALEGRLELAGRPGEIVAHARFGEKVDDWERAFDPVKYGELPQRPCLDVYVPSEEDPGLAPSGYSVVSIQTHFIPYGLAGGWNDEARETVGDTTIDILSRYAPALPSQILAREVLTPADLEARYGLVEGHLHHGDHALDQLVLRPTPETAHYRTPIEGLFLCGSGSHPGGGVTCAPGALAAGVILKSG